MTAATHNNTRKMVRYKYNGKSGDVIGNKVVLFFSQNAILINFLSFFARLVEFCEFDCVFKFVQYFFLNLAWVWQVFQRISTRFLKISSTNFVNLINKIKVSIP